MAAARNGTERIGESPRWAASLESGGTNRQSPRGGGPYTEAERFFGPPLQRFRHWGERIHDSPRGCGSDAVEKRIGTPPWWRSIHGSGTNPRFPASAVPAPGRNRFAIPAGAAVPRRWRNESAITPWRRSIHGGGTNPRSPASAGPTRWRNESAITPWWRTIHRVRNESAIPPRRRFRNGAKRIGESFRGGRGTPALLVIVRGHPSYPRGAGGGRVRRRLARPPRNGPDFGGGCPGGRGDSRGPHDSANRSAIRRMSAPMSPLSASAFRRARRRPPLPGGVRSRIPCEDRRSVPFPRAPFSV